MTPKEKAIDLVNRFEKEVPTHHYNFGTYQAIVCALIAVDEIISVIENGNPIESQWQFWQQVKQEIENL